MSVPKISLLLPTRGRVHLVQRFFDSLIQNTADLSCVEVILYVDEDDVVSHGLDCENVQVTRIIGPVMTMGKYNSACLAKARGDIIILVNDDMVIRTPAWDQQVIAVDNAFPDKIYLAFANDLFRKNWCTFPILSRRTCELLVEPYPHRYRGAFIDIHLWDLFQRLRHAGFDRICSLNKVVFEHLHYRTGKAPLDDTYRKRQRFGDDASFIALADARSQGAACLIGAIQNKEVSPPGVSTEPEDVPSGIFAATLYFTKRFLLDSELPKRWRGFLWYWFIGRYVAARGRLRFFMRSQ